MPPYDSTIYVYSKYDSSVCTIIQWLNKKRLSFFHIVLTHNVDMSLIPFSHDKIMKRQNIKQYSIYIFLGKYTQTKPFHSLKDLKSWFYNANSNILNNTNTKITIENQLSTLRLDDQTTTLSSTIMMDMHATNSISGICMACNVKDNRPCTYSINTSSNGYCGSHYKCSLKRLRVCIYTDDDSVDVNTNMLRKFILNIKTFTKQETENVEIGILLPSHFTKIDQRTHKEILSTQHHRPLYIFGWNDAIKIFSSIHKCCQWVESLVSFTRCCYHDISSNQRCNNLSVHSKVSYCEHHLGGGSGITTIFNIIKH
jgi:hypothetical protein